MSSRNGHAASRRHQAGFNLVELMVALLIGLLVSAAAITVFLSNRQAYAATEGVGRLQESARVAFEMMSRDLREAGGNPCDVQLPVANVLQPAEAAKWYANWSQPIRGFDDTASASAPTGRKAGTDAIQVLAASDNLSTVALHVPLLVSNAFTLTSASQMVNNDIVLVCDTQQVAIFQAANVLNLAVASSLLGNRCQVLGTKPSVCSGITYQFKKNSVMTPLASKQWYVGTNSRGGTSLFQRTLRAGSEQAEEIVDGVTGMQITYLVRTGTQYNPAALISDWSVVTAARITLTVSAPGTKGTDGQPLSRTLVHTINFRNRTLQS